MTITHIERLIDTGNFSKSDAFKKTMDEITNAIYAVTWPQEAPTFRLFPEKQGNGVAPIKYQCLKHLKDLGWRTEYRMKLVANDRPGPVDAIKILPNGFKFAFEWETGNISSSHRSLNRMVIGLLENIIIGGALVLPSRKMYEYLTDRIGNYQELRPYFPVWQNVRLPQGTIIVFEVQHDGLSNKVQRIPKGADGNAFRALIAS